MPKVDGKDYPYTAAGKKAADTEKKKKKVKVRKPDQKSFKVAKEKAVDPPGSIRNRQFLQKFHDDVVKRDRGGIDKASGKPTTMKLGTVGVDGKTFVLPLYNPETRKTGTGKEALERFKEDLPSLTGFKSTEEAEDDLRVNRLKVIAATKKKKKRR
tara:strand:- start:1231 stop:1698 length:468 start_codon:yes stop_codon:yes gene_type:complete